MRETDHVVLANLLFPYTEESKKISDAGNGKGLLFVFGAQDLKVDWYTETAAAVRHAIHCYVSSTKRKRATN